MASSLSDKILKDIYHILKSDPYLNDFCIVTVEENTNKSPVLHEEHSLGLESWCVKHVYKHIYKEIFTLRKQLKKGRLPPDKIHTLNLQLIGALLINPDVVTFWNMRKELIEYGYISGEEFLLTKLVLSFKSKSYETFAHRRWAIVRELKQGHSIDLDVELSLTEMSGSRSPNNFHAWVHRIWTLETITTPISPTLIISTQLNFSLNWINHHVSESCGFHFRQRLFELILRTPSLRKITRMRDHTPGGLHEILGVAVHDLIGHGINSSLNYSTYLHLLIVELVCVVKDLSRAFPGHEAIWYHHRYVVARLVWALHEYHNCPLEERIQIDDLHLINAHDSNITNLSCDAHALTRNRETVAETTVLYKFIVNYERNAVNECKEAKCSLQRKWAEKHERWLRLVLHLSGL